MFKIYAFLNGKNHYSKVNKNLNAVYLTAVEYFRKKFGINHEIKLKNKKSNSRSFGHITLSKTSEIYVDTDAWLELVIARIIHEVTHIKQVDRNELSATPDHKYILWHGKPFISVSDYQKLNYDEHAKMPWEEEAYKNMKSLKVEFLSSKEFLELKN